MGRRAVAWVAAVLCFESLCRAQWSNYAGDPQHSALSATASQTLRRIHWQTPVDLAPEYSDGDLLIHYGSPLVTAANTVIVPIKTGSRRQVQSEAAEAGGENSGPAMPPRDNFTVEARSGADGRVIWKQTTDYILPMHNWTPPLGLALAPGGRLYFPGAAGTVYYRDTPDNAAGEQGQLAFYGISQYEASRQSRHAFQRSVKISTPLTADALGNIYFGFVVEGNPGLWPLYDASGRKMESGIARIAASGESAWIPASVAAGDSAITQVVMNCAPAISNDGAVVYIAVSDQRAGYLLALSSTTLSPLARVRLKDPKSGRDAILSDSGTASPAVGPDGDVYFGVRENPCCRENHDRGWLLHFDSTLARFKTPSAFGWDNTPSVVPASLVSSYSGTSRYLLFSKFNDYWEAGGDGRNRIAILDPNATETEPVNQIAVMRQVLTILGPTPADDGVGVREWCINSAAVDPATKSVLANNEDGILYRWDLTTNTLSQKVVLTAGFGEAYTPTVIGVDGTVYAINDAILFAVGE